MSPRAFGLLALSVAGGLSLAVGALAQSAGTSRETVHVVTAGFGGEQISHALTAAASTRLGQETRFQADSLSFAAGMDRFCRGIGPATPDILISNRRLPRSMVETCALNGVTEIIELDLGRGALVLATPRNASMPGLTDRQIYTALAAVLPNGREFVANSNSRWSDVGDNLPNTPIAVIIPSSETSLRSLFNDRVLEAGCRHVPAIRRIFSANDRVEKCVTLRADGRIREMALGDVPAALLAAPAGTLGVVTYQAMIMSGGNLVSVPLNGVMPSAATIANGDYDAVRDMFVYIKRQHVPAIVGERLATRIRNFAQVIVSEEFIGPGGPLAAAGLQPLSPAERIRQREIAARQTLLTR